MVKLKNRRLWRPLATLGAIALVSATLFGGQAISAQASAAKPNPVFAPAGDAADPGVVRDGRDYYLFTTGGRAHVAHADKPQGPWTALPDALTDFGPWASGNGAVWAPNAVETSAGWVLYYAVQAKGFKGQRCIGTAVSDAPPGPYIPSASPLICPILNGEDPVTDRPDQTSGVIDASPFQADDGQRYLLYKTQKSPGTIRMFPLSADGLHGRGEVSHELMRHFDSVEAPVMVQRGEYYVLFAAANWYDQCRYSTVWRRSTDLWSFADKEEHVLVDSSNTGLCGPGGAAIVAQQQGPSRIFVHAWVCSQSNEPCRFDGLVQDPNKRRAIYAAVLTWGDDGATPAVPAFLPSTS